jgi:glyoxylase-like metal-dependent hydrolase (beta-lactamase superfamily II)
MSNVYGPANEDEAIATIHRALDLGVNFLDTADVYGSGHNERLCPTNDDARARLASDQRATFTPVVADVTVDAELSLLDATGIPARVRALPGHTEGSLVVTVADGVFVGDLLRGDAIWSSAEVHFYMCDLEDNRRDVLTVLDQVAPGAAQWFPGHFGPLSRDAVRARFSPTR